MTHGFDAPMLIRADAGGPLGTGHVMRTIALAQTWKMRAAPDVSAHLLARELPPALRERAAAERIITHDLCAERGTAADASETIRLAKQFGAPWIVADGYAFGKNFQTAIRDAGLRLLLVDDFGHAEHYVADVVVNQNISASTAIYAAREAQTRLLLGTRYAMLRREFWPWRQRERATPDIVRHVVVTLGGTDPDNVTTRIVTALRDLPGLSVTLVIGGGNPHQRAVELAVKAANAAEGARFAVAVNPPTMPNLLASADLAITAAASTMWETMLLGVPSLAIVTADNQRGSAIEADRRGIVESLGWHGDLPEPIIADRLRALMADSARRKRMVEMAKTCVDGWGAERVLDAWQSPDLVIRPATVADCRRIWEWANDPATRHQSFDSAPIPWDTHERWFVDALRNPGCWLFVGTTADDTPVGQVRFNRLATADNEAIVSVGLGPNARGMGLGKRLIALATAELFRISPIALVHAFIKPENTASVRAFERANYRENGRSEVKQHPALHFIHRRPTPALPA